MKYIFWSNGNYLGFIDDSGNLFSRDGLYLGWVEGSLIWGGDDGQFRGQTWGDKYILRNKYSITPIAKIPRTTPVTPVLPTPPANIAPTILPVGFVDAFDIQ